MAHIVLGGDLEAKPGDEIVDARGGSVLAGFIDTHCHPYEYGWLKRSVDLRGTSNITGLRLRLQAGINRALPGDWVSGMGWDQEAFPEGQMPTNKDIDDISPSNPVALSRICGHVALLNSVALDSLGFASRTGPEYERGSDGMLTGIVKEQALGEVFSRIPRSAKMSAADLQSVEAEAAKFGLTTLHCILSPEGFREELEALEGLNREQSLSLRYRVYVPSAALESLNEKDHTHQDPAKGRVNGVKIYADGSLGAGTAALREPYTDAPTNNGILRYSSEKLTELVEKIDRKGYQVIIHAIGDRAVEQAIEALSVVTGTGSGRRHRIEHASLLPRDLRSKMVKYNIRAAVQPLFITSDTWAVKRLGEERVRDLYPLRSMLEEGIVASGGSDSPVESMSPVLGIWAALTRGGTSSSENIGLSQAISIYTSNAASNGFDDSAGAVSEGAVADLTVLDSDIADMHPALLRKVGILATIVGGTVVHSFDLS
jgi:predicted amidohydrolase YtcJ